MITPEIYNATGPANSTPRRADFIGTPWDGGFLPSREARIREELVDPRIQLYPSEKALLVDWPEATVILGVLATLLTGILRMSPPRRQQEVGTKVEVLKVQYQGLRDEMHGLREELHKLREVLLALRQQNDRKGK